jgi:hypothetical protein
MRGLALDQSDQVAEAAAASGAAGAGASPGKASAAAGAGPGASSSAAEQQLEEQLGLKDTMLSWVSWLAQEYGPGSGGEAGSDSGSATAGEGGRSRRQLLAVQQVVAAIAEAVGGQRPGRCAVPGGCCLAAGAGAEPHGWLHGPLPALAALQAPTLPRQRTVLTARHCAAAPAAAAGQYGEHIAKWSAFSDPSLLSGSHGKSKGKGGGKKGGMQRLPCRLPCACTGCLGHTSRAARVWGR